MDHLCKRNCVLFITQPSHNDWCNGKIYKIHFIYMSNWVPMNSTCWHEAYRLFKVFSQKTFHVFVVPDVFHWRNTFHTIVGVQQLGQIKDNSFSILQFSFLSKQSIIFLQTAVIVIIFWDFLMFYQIFLSPQVKRCAIITYKHGICKSPHELLVPNPPAKMKILLILAKSSWKTDIKLFPQCATPHQNWS